MANIKNELNNIKSALYGKDVRSSIHNGIDAINNEVESTTGRQVDLENTFDQLIINAGNSNAEIVDARVKNDGTSYSKLGDRLDAVDSQLEQITINIKDFGAKCDGVTDDTKALQDSIDFVRETLILNEVKERRYGRILLPPGVICISSINLYSNIVLEGSGIYSTRIKPISPNVNLINIYGTAYETDMIRFAEINNLSISPNDDLRAVGNEVELISVINLHNTERCRINNIAISDIKGVGINQKTNMDCYINRVEIGNVETPLYFGCSETDVTNAVHITDCRFEINTKPIVFEGEENRYIREIYFNNCKFERTQFKFSNTLHINFSNCHFTDINNKTTFTIDNTYNVGININGGSVTSGHIMTHKICDNNSDYYVTFNGLNITNCHNDEAVFTGKNIKITNSDFVNCTHPLINASDVVFNNNTSKNLHRSDGTKYAVILHDNSICCNNILECENGIYMNSMNSVTNNSIRSNSIGYYVNSSGNLISDRGVGSVTYSSDSMRVWNKVNRELTNISGVSKYINCNVGTNNNYGDVTYIDLSDIKKLTFNINSISCEVSNVDVINETVTVKYKVFDLENKSFYIEKQAVKENYGGWLSEDELHSLLSNSYITVSKIGISAKSNMQSSNAIVKSKVIIL